MTYRVGTGASQILMPHTPQTLVVTTSPSHFTLAVIVQSSSPAWVLLATIISTSDDSEFVMIQGGSSKIPSLPFSLNLGFKNLCPCSSCCKGTVSDGIGTVRDGIIGMYRNSHRNSQGWSSVLWHQLDVYIFPRQCISVSRQKAHSHHTPFFFPYLCLLWKRNCQPEILNCFLKRVILSKLIGLLLFLIQICGFRNLS